MRKLLGALFPGPAAAESAIGAAVKGLDSLFYTDQEKAEDKQAAKRQAADMYIQWMAATSGQNRARRAVALTVTAIWAFMLMAGFALDVAAVWVPDAYYDRIVESGKAVASRSSEIHTPFLAVLGFYFSSRVVGGLIDKVKGDKA